MSETSQDELVKISVLRCTEVGCSIPVRVFSSNPPRDGTHWNNGEVHASQPYSHLVKIEDADVERVSDQVSESLTKGDACVVLQDGVIYLELDMKLYESMELVDSLRACGLLIAPVHMTTVHVYEVTGIVADMETLRK